MKRAILWLLRAYKRTISPMLLPACRYVPTCSQYALEAIEHYGILHGGWKTVWRVARCNPFARGGYDPVTPPSEFAGSGVDLTTKHTHLRIES
jgi:putative membrane protein insertion efficiency factor